MRFTATLSATLLIAVLLASVGPPAARADNNDLGHAQRFLNNQGDDRDAYQRGRDDEIRRQ